MKDNQEELNVERGRRVYLIRAALGTMRKAMPLDEFSALIARTSGVVYDPSILSRMETGQRRVTLEDIEAIAPLDPERRGRTWLALWDDERDKGAVRGEPPQRTSPTEPCIIETKPTREQPRIPGKPIKRRHDRSAIAS